MVVMLYRTAEEPFFFLECSQLADNSGTSVKYRQFLVWIKYTQHFK